jgi:GAF domain-containing protein
MGRNKHQPERSRWLGPPRDLVERLCDLCVLSSGVDGGSVTLVTPAGGGDLVHATDETARAIGDLQGLLGEGPALDALRGGGPVLIDDVLDHGEGVRVWWAALVPELAALGARALFAFPLRVGPVALGVFELYRHDPGPPGPAELRQMLSTADGIVVALLDVAERNSGEHAPAAPGARVHQAAGMLMVQLDSSVDEAMVRLRATAYAEGSTLDDVASSVVARRRRFSREAS